MIDTIKCPGKITRCTKNASNLLPLQININERLNVNLVSINFNKTCYIQFTTNNNVGRVAQLV